MKHSDFRLGLVLLVAISVLGCGGDDGAGGEAGGEVTDSAADPDTSSTVAPGSDEWPVRQFDPIGNGVLTLDAGELLFDVADCELDEVEEQNGFVRDAMIVGAGVHDGKEFFVEIKHWKMAGKTARPTVNIHFLPLHERYLNLSTGNEADLNVMERVMNSSGFRTLSLDPDDLVIAGSTVSTPDPIKLLVIEDGQWFQQQVVESTFEIHCN